MELKEKFHTMLLFLSYIVFRFRFIDILIQKYIKY